MAIAIKVENLSKAYQLGTIGTGTIANDLNRWYAKVRGKEDPFLKIGETNDRTTNGKSNTVWSLKDINFEIQEGDAVGIIGKNGAGKSTLLKILSRVTAPTTGLIKVKGRIASLLEVGTGFHSELTGKENIYLNGAILGMRKKEITKKLDEIVAFSGVERYIDTPVKRYSSGMYVRLAFAVAAHLESEILIVDEVLAVGDAEFQKKCLGKMNDVSKGEGRTVLFVSHNMGSVQNLCTNGLLLKKGSINYNGDIEEVIVQYSENSKSADINIFKAKEVGLLRLNFYSKIYQDNKFRFGENIILCMLWLFETSLKNRVISIRIYNSYDELICGYNTLSESYLDTLVEKGEYKVKIDIENGLPPGLYYLTIGSFIRPHTIEFIYEKQFEFEVLEEVENKSFTPNIVGKPRYYSKSNWIIKKENL